MPNLEINKPDRVLVKISPGKSYITDPNKFVVQHKQKKPTCWYNVYLHQRPRYGKGIDALVAKAKDIPELKDNADFQALAAGRKTEKIISNFRKEIGSLQAALHLTQDLTKLGKNEGKDPQEIKALQERFTKQIKEKSFALTEGTAKLLSDSAESLFKNSLERVKSYYQIMHTYETRQSDTKRLEYSTQLITMINTLIPQSYHLPLSNWRPSQGIKELMEELREHGAISVGGDFGESHYKNPPTRSKDLTGGHEIYFWKPQEYEFKSDTPAHAILIVGAEIIGGKENVYYFDPNTEINTSDKPHLYKISYNRLKDNVNDNSGLANNLKFLTLYYAHLSLTNSQCGAEPLKAKYEYEQLCKSGYFAYRTNTALINETQNQYQRVCNFIEINQLKNYLKKEIENLNNVMFFTKNRNHKKSLMQNLLSRMQSREAVVNDKQELINFINETETLAKIVRYSDVAKLKSKISFGMWKSTSSSLENWKNLRLNDAESKDPAPSVSVALGK